MQKNQANTQKLKATGNSFTVRGICVDSSNYFAHTMYFMFFTFRFRLQKYANARKAVHAVSSEASWYYELPCFCSCIKNYSVKDIIFTVQFTCNYTYTLEARKFTLKSVQNLFSLPSCTPQTDKEMYFPSFV